MKPLGYLRLIEEFDLPVCKMLWQWHLTEQSRFSATAEGDISHFALPADALKIDDTWQGHLLFAVRKEGINLEVLKALFAKVDARDIENLVRQDPAEVTRRRIWFLSEYLTESRLALPDLATGDYEPLVVESKQFACPKNKAKRARRMRILNNLLGDRSFSPLVRKALGIWKNPTEELRSLVRDLFMKHPTFLKDRALPRLYEKEAKSSLALDRETPDPPRVQTLVDALRSPLEVPVTKETLLDVQNRTDDSQRTLHDWRTPEVDDIMSGYLRTLNRLLASDFDLVVLAAVMSFAFAFIRPLDHGNGRLHRYLLHAILSRLNFKYILSGEFPFALSEMLRKRPTVYDHMLGSFARRVPQRLKRAVTEDGEVPVCGESLDLCRYIDFTPIVEAFMQLIADSLQTEWKPELAAERQKHRELRQKRRELRRKMLRELRRKMLCELRKPASV